MNDDEYWADCSAKWEACCKNPLAGTGVSVADVRRELRKRRTAWAVAPAQLPKERILYAAMSLGAKGYRITVENLVAHIEEIGW